MGGLSLRAALLGLALLAPALAPAQPRQTAIARAEAVAKREPKLGTYVIAERGVIATNDGALVVGTTPPAPPLATVQPWASVTKQVIAVMVMQQVAEGRLTLDAPIDRYLDALPGTDRQPTVRELLQHRSGLWNPDDSPADAAGQPGWYGAGDDPRAACRAGRTAPGGNWRYNNCDYLLLGAILENTGGAPLDAQFRARIAAPAQLADTHFAGRPPPVPVAKTFDATEERLLARYGAAGGLVGSAEDLYRFDRALIDGRLLPANARATLWQSDPALGFMALGQWVFDVQPRGCAAPLHVVERRGAIGRFQVRNILVPDRDLVIVLFVPDATFDFSEIWRGAGLSHDVLAAAACS